MAVVLHVPAIFVFENNGYGEHTGASYAVGAPELRARCEGFGMLALAGDGNDFYAVQDLMNQALKHARNGKGPVALELHTQRYFGHFEGDPQRYRAKGEVAKARETVDCLLQFRKHPKSAAMSEKGFAAIDEEVMTLIEEITVAAKAAPAPDPAEVLTDVYANY
jgi:pyruvate dehydrogenase E1 component alpha subunit